MQAKGPQFEHAVGELSVRVPARPDAVSRARHLVGDQLRAVGMDRERVMDVQLAVSEAVGNAVLHAYPDGAEPGPVEIEARIDEDGVSLLVRDYGCGEPHKTRGGAGLGLPLLRSLADHVSVEHRPEQGTAVTMRFRPRR